MLTKICSDFLILHGLGAVRTAGAGCWIKVEKCPKHQSYKPLFYDAEGATNAQTGKSVCQSLSLTVCLSPAIRRTVHLGHSLILKNLVNKCSIKVDRTMLFIIHNTTKALITFAGNSFSAFI